MGVAEKTEKSLTRSNVGDLQRRHVTKDVAPRLPLGGGCTQSIFPSTPTVGGRRAWYNSTGGLGDGIGLLLAAAPDRSGSATDARGLGTHVLLNAFRQRERLFPIRSLSRSLLR